MGSVQAFNWHGRVAYCFTICSGIKDCFSLLNILNTSSPTSNQLKALRVCYLIQRPVFECLMPLNIMCQSFILSTILLYNSKCCITQRCPGHLRGLEDKSKRASVAFCPCLVVTAERLNLGSIILVPLEFSFCPAKPIISYLLKEGK